MEVSVIHDITDADYTAFQSMKEGKQDAAQSPLSLTEGLSSADTLRQDHPQLLSPLSGPLLLPGAKTLLSSRQ